MDHRIQIGTHGKGGFLFDKQGMIVFVETKELLCATTV